MAVGCVLGALGGCSFGTVYDEETRAPLGGVSLDVRGVVLSGGGPVQLSSEPLRVRTWSETDQGSPPGGFWYLNPYAPRAPGDTTNTVIASGWNRFILTRDGYDARAFFRNHLYTPCSADTANPYSGGRYPFAPGQTVNGLCANENFELYPSSSNYVKDPDMIVDPRSILDATYIANRGRCENRSNTCIRLSVGTANIGVGDLWLTAPTAQNDQVTQHRFRRNEGEDQTLLRNAVFVRDGHAHLHLANWTNLRLRQRTQDCAAEANAALCPIVGTGAKISFCLMETNQFDDHSAYRRNRSYSCTETDGLISQGIGAGRMDVYGSELSGQMIPTDGLPSGEYWLEVEVNPLNADGTRTVLESEYENNISRTIIRIP